MEIQINLFSSNRKPKKRFGSINITNLNNKSGGIIKKQKTLQIVEYINENWGHWCSNHCKYATETINILKGDDKDENN